MNIVKFEFSHSFCSFDITFIICHGKEILHNLVEMIICQFVVTQGPFKYFSKTGSF